MAQINVIFRWDKPTNLTEPNGYKVYSGNAPGVYVGSGTRVDGADTLFLETTVDSELTTYYAVAAFNEYGEGELSDPVLISKPGKPTNFRVQ